MSLNSGQLRKKIPALREALEGPFEDEHGLIVGQILAHIDFLDPSLSTSGETLTIEELLTLRARTETRGSRHRCGQGETPSVGLSRAFRTPENPRELCAGS